VSPVTRGRRVRVLIWSSSMVRGRRRRTRMLSSLDKRRERWRRERGERCNSCQVSRHIITILCAGPTHDLAGLLVPHKTGSGFLHAEEARPVFYFRSLLSATSGLTRRRTFCCAPQDSIPIRRDQIAGPTADPVTPRRHTVAFRSGTENAGTDEPDHDDLRDATFGYPYVGYPHLSATRMSATRMSATACRQPALTFQWSRRSSASTKNELQDSGDEPRRHATPNVARRFLHRLAEPATVGAAPHLRAQTQHTHRRALRRSVYGAGRSVT